METNQANRSVRTVFAVTLITAALMVMTNYALTGAELRTWWLPAVLLIGGLVLALPINLLLTRVQPAAAPASGSFAPQFREYIVTDSRPVEISAEVVTTHPTPTEIAEQVRHAPPVGDSSHDASTEANAIGSDPDAPIHIEYHETGNTHEIPTLGVNPDADSTQPESGLEPAHPAESPAEPGEIPKEKPELRDPQRFDSPGYTRDTTADEGMVIDSSGTLQAVTPEQPAPTAEPPTIRHGTPDVTKEPGDTSAAIAPNSGESLTTDDLVKIDGIGARIAGVLIEAGIDTYVRLAATSQERLREILTAAGIRLAPTLSTWADQAALASKGDWEGLRRYTAERKASRGGGEN